MAKWRMRGTEGEDGSEIVSLIGEGTVFTGQLELKGGARIDGKVVGRITAHSLLVVGPTGDIEAEELRANSVTVCGHVHGKIIVEERLEIQPGGRVSGQIIMQKEGLVVAPGGIFEGAVEYSREGKPADDASRAYTLEATV